MIAAVALANVDPKPFEDLPKPNIVDAPPKEIYVIQVTTFDYGHGSLQLRHHTFHEFFLTREAAELKIRHLAGLGPRTIECRYFIQTLWPAESGPRVVPIMPEKTN